MIEDHQNKDIHLVKHNVHVVFHRVSGNQLPDDKPICNIADFEYAKLPPSLSDHTWQRLDYVTLIERVLTNNLPCLASYQSEVTQHIPHQHSKEM